MCSETNTDPKEWFVGERGDLIMGLWSLIIFHQKKKKEFMDNIRSKMTLKSLYEVSSYTYEHTYNNEAQKWKTESQKDSWARMKETNI